MGERSWTVRCAHCKTAQLVTATLEDARKMRCGQCHQKMTVAGYQDQDGETHPGDLPAVTKAPGIEKADWAITEKQDETARRLVLSALDEEE